MFDPNSNDIEFFMPSGVKHLGEALVPVVRSLRQALVAKVRSSGPEFVLLEDISLHMRVISNALAHLSSRLDSLMISLIKDEKAGMAEGYRAAGRLEQVISELVDGFQKVQISRASEEVRHPRALLLGVYRHIMQEIFDWLEDLVQVIASPRAEMEKRGIPLAETVELTIVLRLTTAPEMAELQELSQQLLISSEQVPEPESESPHRYQVQTSASPGFLGVIGALEFGAGITKAVFGHRSS